MLLWKMVSESEFRFRTLGEAKAAVLILVVVEDGLRVQLTNGEKTITRCVLILVVVEDGLRVLNSRGKGDSQSIVLILVVVEDGLRARLVDY